jgi:hypothetical protein
MQSLGVARLCWYLQVDFRDGKRGQCADRVALLSVKACQRRDNYLLVARERRASMKVQDQVSWGPSGEIVVMMRQ